ncbi:MAG: hypothetical protein M1818_001092 [Claussenomyces sp. TS43310]|nr:MAG: hypothetical protein M1818_001092 [Claussenomyces sp. TS43310]
MATATWDVGRLSTFLNVSEPLFTNLLDTPTVELVKLVLDAVATKAYEYEELQSDKIRLEVELENAVRTSENRAQGIKVTIDNALNEVNDLQNARSRLEGELQQFKSSSSTSSSEIDHLKIRIATLESANRDTIAVLESKTTANDTLAQDLQKQHQKGLELSQQISTLQLSVQNANSAASSAKFREQSLKQELEQAKRNNDWLDTELKNKSAEALKSRKEKGARISELQRLNDEANANLDSLKRTESALRCRLDEIQKKAEESLGKVQQLQEAAAATQEGFRQELESSRRLTDLQAQQAETHRNRLTEVEASLEKTKDEAIEEVNRLQQQVEDEKQNRERLEHHISELEAEIDRLEATAASQPQPGSLPETPRQGQNGSIMSRGGSPFTTPGSLRGKSSITATQAIEELYKIKGQLATEKRRNDRLCAEMEEMVQGLEAKQPEIEELQAEHGRLQQEVIAMSKFVDQTGKEMDRAKRDARKAESEAATAQAEGKILSQQLRDLSAQVKLLLCDIDARERGFDALSALERVQLERLAKGEVSEEALEGLTDTDRFISHRLTVFRSISELQEKNQELLKITRQLGAQMESEEALAAKHQAAKDHEQVRILQKRIESYKDELKSMVTRSESYIKERDMFRRMLQHRGQLPPNSDLVSVFGQSVEGSGVLNSVEQSPNEKDSANYAALLRELQSHFDQYRNEQDTDRRTMKEQSEKLATDKSCLQSEVAKTSSQLTLANERFEMLQANYSMLQTENKELQKRSQLLSESAAKQDLRTQQVAEDLIEARGLVESMRNETANLKAEKKLWKEVQDRLAQDNDNLMSERSRLNGIISNQQTLQNERELSEMETRRRFQTRVESLETELNATKRKLNEEMEDNKRAQLRKEYDSQQSQKRIDDLATSIGSLREELVATKTARDHLQARVDELMIELKSAEERVELLQPRPTPRPGLQTTSPESIPNAEDSMSREQGLAIEISELKRDLDLTKAELDSTKIQMEQYKAISQSAEEELQSMNETQDQYRQEMDQIIGNKDSEIRELQKRIEEISTELSASSEELNIMRTAQADAARHAVEERSLLNAEIIRLRDQDERHATAAQFHQQDLRAQAEIAAKAQQDYENELVKHADAARLLQSLRIDYNVLKTESAELRAEAESSKVALSQSQSSWEERREQFEKELNELRSRRDDVGAQNKLLLQQLESVSAQVTELQVNRASFADTTDSEVATTTSNDPSIDGLRELITYLRRDKEIVDVQYELSIQESKRLRQQIDYAQSQLDETRLKLDQERRSQADGSRSTMAHKELMEKLNELNLFRESSITLRNEARQAQAQLAQKTTQVEELLASIQPLETKVRELEGAREMQEGEIRLLHEDRDRWQKRNQEILSKYDRIDPAEMEQLKESIQALQSERDSLVADQQPLREKVTTLEGEKVAWQQTREKIVAQAKERNRVLTKDKNDRISERDIAIAEKETVEQQLSSIRGQLEASIKEKRETESEFINLRQELSAARSDIERLSSNSIQRNSGAEKLVEPEPHEDGSVNERLIAIRKELEAAIKRKADVEKELYAVRQELESTRSERDRALADVAQAPSETAARATDVSTELRSEDGQIDESQPGISKMERKALEERLAVAEARAKAEEEKAKQFEEDMENTLKQRSEKMKAALNKKLAESRETSRTDLETEFLAKLEREKKTWLAEKASATAPSAIPERTDDVVAAGTATVAAPISASTPSTMADLANLSDSQVKDFLASNSVVKSILSSNLRKKVEAETAKVKEEFEKTIEQRLEAERQQAKREFESMTAQKLAEAEKKADEGRVQAVMMESKKSALKLNMLDNRAKATAVKLQIVEKAATETPEKPVGQVWAIAKDAKLPANITTAATQSSSAPVRDPVVSNQAIKAEPANSTIPKGSSGEKASKVPSAPQVSQASSVQYNQNGTSSIPAKNTASEPAPQPTNPTRTGLPVPNRGGGLPRGARGGGIYQRGGRGRGGPMQRGGGAGGSMNPGAPAFSPGGAGNKRPHDDNQNGASQDNQKRIRSGGGAS